MHIFFVLKKTKYMNKLFLSSFLLVIQILLFLIPISLKILFVYDKNKSTFTLKLYTLYLIKFLEIEVLFIKKIIRVKGLINNQKSFNNLTFKKFKLSWLIKALKLLKANITYDLNVNEIISKNSALLSNFAVITVIETLKKIYFKKTNAQVLLNYTNTIVSGKFLIFTSIFLILFELLKSIIAKTGVKNATKRLYPKPN